MGAGEVPSHERVVGLGLWAACVCGPHVCLCCVSFGQVGFRTTLPWGGYTPGNRLTPVGCLKEGGPIHPTGYFAVGQLSRLCLCPARFA